MKVRAGDTVVVIAGNDKGRKGVVKQVLRERQRVVVEGVNLRWKHRKPSQANPKGERVQNEVAIHVSNVMHVDAAGEATRRAPARVEKNHPERARSAAAAPAGRGKKGR